MSKDYILVTGATGFIGKSIIENYKHCRMVIRNKSSKKLSKNNSFLINNLDGTTSWEGAFHNINTIIHLAGLAHVNTFSKENYWSTNVDGTLRLAKQASLNGVKRFVFVSSIGVNGTSTYDKPFSPESEPTPHNMYASSKYIAELGLQKISEETGLEIVIVRPTLVYGPDAPGSFGYLSNLVKYSPCLPFGAINNKRSFISVQNLADLLITCATHSNAPGNTFLASDCKSVSIKKFTNGIAKGLGTNLVQLPVPVNLIRLAGNFLGKSAMVEQMVGNLEVDSTNLKTILDWTPPYTLEESMAFLK
ncbi:MAG: NAD-dependent epimerase/dehydratase family protein [Hellea sp.]